MPKTSWFRSEGSSDSSSTVSWLSWHQEGAAPQEVPVPSLPAFLRNCPLLVPFTSKWLCNYICECNPAGHYSNYSPQSLSTAFREIICAMKWGSSACRNVWNSWKHESASWNPHALALAQEGHQRVQCTEAAPQ